MVNIYYKLLNNNLSSKYTKEVIDSLQEDLYTQIKELKLQAYFTEEQLSNQQLDINSLLKYYLIGRIVSNKSRSQKHSEKTKDEKEFLPTNNPDISQNRNNGKFYILRNSKLVEILGIREIRQDGSYMVITSETSNSCKIIREYDVNHNLIEMQLIYSNNKIERDKNQVAAILGLRKIITKKYKYKGYSGNSNDFLSGILNNLSSPIDTGCYMDHHYNYYEWSDVRHSFIRSYKNEPTSPLLVDYDFLPNGDVVKKEYIGDN